MSAPEEPLSVAEGRCEWCGVPEDDTCADGCGCASCEVDRALDEDDDARSRR